MRSNWSCRRVADLAAEGVLEIGDGYRAKNAELSTHGLPFARAANINAGFKFDDVDRVPSETLSRVGRKRSMRGDVVFTSKGTVGRFALVGDKTEPFVFSPQLCFWRSLRTERLDPRFLFFWFHGRECGDQLNVLKGQTDMADYVSLRDQRAMTLTLPPIAEQRAIASVLGAVDDKIESNRRLSKASEAVAAGACLQVARIGSGPPEWSVRRFSDVVLVNPTVRIPKGTDTPFIEMAAVGPFATRPNREARRQFAGGAKFAPGDTLMARITGCIEHGKGAFVDFLDEPAAGSTEFIVFRATESLSPEAVFVLSRDEQLRAHAIQNMVGTSGRQRVDNACWDSLEVVLAPPSDSRSAVLRLMTAQFEASRGLWSEARILTSLRDALLPKLVSGQIRVPLSDDPEESLGAAVEQHQNEAA